MKQRKADFRNNLLFRSLLFCNLIFLISGISSIPALAGVPAQRANFNKDTAIQYVRSFDFESLRLAVTDLIETFGPEYI
ncbi:MAG: hypothetical protein ACYSUX_05460 [Planctomycetota bacterium]